MHIPRVWLIVIAACFGLSGSSTLALTASDSMDLFNNTHDAVELINSQKGAVFDVLLPGRSKLVPYAEGVSLRVDGQLIHFNRVEPPAEYVRKGLLSKTIRGQLNSDLKIWLLPLSSNRPVLRPIPQPAGFPLSLR